MNSIAKTKRRSKKTTRVGPVRVIRPEQYAGFAVNSKLECIQALIPLDLMRFLLDSFLTFHPFPLSIRH